MLSFSSSLYEGIVDSALRERQQNLENSGMRKGGNRESGRFALLCDLNMQQTTLLILMNTTLIAPELKLLVSSSLRLSVLNLTTPQPCTPHLRKSSLLRLLRDFILLLSLLLDVADAHASDGALHLERLLASLLALLSSLGRQSHSYSDLPRSSCCCVSRRQSIGCEQVSSSARSESRPCG